MKRSSRAPGFGGGHEQAVIAVLNNQYDAGCDLDLADGRRGKRLYPRKPPPHGG